MYRNIFFFFFLSFFFYQANCQPDESTGEEKKKNPPINRFFTFSLGRMNFSVQDGGLTPLVYRGKGPFIHLGLYGYRKKSLNLIDVSLTGGLIYNKFFQEQNQVNYSGRGEISYAHLTQLEKTIS
ncbi:MAG: hypothetical protein ACOCUL_03450 [Bacteroidota bacterium]